MRSASLASTVSASDEGVSFTPYQRAAMSTVTQSMKQMLNIVCEVASYTACSTVSWVSDNERSTECSTRV